MALPFRRVGISGLGLIGGSIAFSLRDRAPECVLLGADPDASARDRARASGALGTVRERVVDIAREVDLLVLSSPVPAIVEDLRVMAAMEGLRLTVTDTGSTKSAIVAAAASLPLGVGFVGGHPMAGGERRGWEAARGDLFDGASWAIVGPERSQEAAAIDGVNALVAILGARAVPLDAATHDRIVAATSHLPQILAVALANVVGLCAERDEETLELAGGGLRDMTRIASSPFAMWEPVLGENREAIASAAARFGEELSRVLNPILASACFDRAAALRQRLLSPAAKPEGPEAAKGSAPRA